MFTSILIANRGEIACRIIRTCRRLGIWTIAVYSEADANALHVRQADEAVCIGSAKAADSYLNVQAILQTARQTKVQAIHPGYGFLSERLDLITACEEAAIAFIGPHRDAIASMGSKIASKRIARHVGIACIPGYDGDDQRLERLHAESLRIGFPLLIKASTGGGGKGMRRVDNAADLESQLHSARAEAHAAFGDDQILLERYIPRPRHVEVQLLGDQHGGLVHLFERECSIQHHYQKLIEETPANHLEPSVKQVLFDAALTLGRTIQYDSVGTVEFVLDADKANTPYFLEMNTRLQVEHPVTEATTGIDLVEWQIRVATGEPLAFTQATLQQSGWAIEARVNAESPADQFAPSFGTVYRYTAPDLPGVRIDTGIDTNSEIPPYYDALLCKVIAAGATRMAAQQRLIQGLKGLQICGVQTTQPLLIDLLKSAAFSDVLTANHLAQQWPQGWQPKAHLMRQAQAIGAATWLHNRLPQNDTPMARLVSWRITMPVDGLGRSHAVVDDGKTRTPLVLRITAQHVFWEDTDTSFQAQHLGHGVWYSPSTNSHWHTQLNTSSVEVWCQGWSCTLSVIPPGGNASANIDTLSASDVITADLPGVLAELLVAPGASVVAGTPVAVLEAMKLRHTLHAPRDGTVHALPVALGATVTKGEVLVTLTPAIATH